MKIIEQVTATWKEMKGWRQQREKGEGEEREEIKSQRSAERE